MKLKQWPANDQPACFEDLSDEVVAAIRFAYDLKRKNRGKNIPIMGPDSPPTGGTTAKGSHYLKASSLKLSEKRHGRDALAEIVDFAIRLGMEQGRRFALSGEKVKGMETKLEMIRIIAGGVEEKAKPSKKSRRRR